MKTDVFKEISLATRFSVRSLVGRAFASRADSPDERIVLEETADFYVTLANIASDVEIGEISELEASRLAQEALYRSHQRVAQRLGGKSRFLRD